MAAARPVEYNANSYWLNFFLSFLSLFESDHKDPQNKKNTHTKKNRNTMKKREKNLEAYTCTKTLHVISSHVTTCMTQTQHYYQEDADY